MLTIHSDPKDIARAYDRKAPGIVSPETQRAYWALERYVNLRWQDAIEDGWRFVPTNQPNHSIAEAARKRFMFVYNEYHGHPAWSDETNYRFRAVHDVYGHIPQGDAAPFTCAGEVEAAKQQVRDIVRTSPRLDEGHRGVLAAEAALTEIVGQAAYFEVHGCFPIQKAALILSADGIL